MKKLAAVTLFLAVLCGCGGSKTTTTISAPALTFPSPTLPNAQVGVSYSTNLIAAGGATPYAWTITTGSLPPGLTIGASTGVISGTPTAAGTYTFTATVKDSSSTAQTKNNSLTIVVKPATLAFMTTSLSPGVTNEMYGTTLQVSGGTPPYTFTLASGSTLPAGLTLTSSGVLSGTPTGTGTGNFTVNVSDSGSPAQTATQALSLSLGATTACGTGNNSVLNGQYTFEISGYNQTGAAALIGSITANGTGGITAGEVDMNSGLGPQTGAITTASSSYSVGANNTGCATIATPFGTFKTQFALGGVKSGVATQGQIINYAPASNTAFVGSGQIAKQTLTASAAGFNSNYAYELEGYDATANGNIACAGVTTFAGTGTAGGTLANGQQDCNDAGTLNSLTVQTGTYTTIDTNGRLTGTNGTTDMIWYMVSPTELFGISTNSNPVLNGLAMQQTVPSGGFVSSSLTGNGVFYASGANSPTTGTALIGTTNSTGAGSISSSAYVDNGGTFSTPNPATTTCSYTVGANGRVTNSGGTCGANAPIYYLTGANTGFVLGTGSNAVSGQLMPQTATGSITSSTQAGNYYFGTTGIASQESPVVVGVATITSTGAINITSNSTSTTSQLQNLIGTDTFVPNANGTFSLGSSSGQIVGVAIGNNQYLLIYNPTGSYPVILSGGQ